MNSYFRKTLRLFLGIRDGESIEDGVRRKTNNLKSIIPHKKYSENEFINDLTKAGICRGDTLIIHSSWRGMYALMSTPASVIDILINIVGVDGTVVMPCYGRKDEVFDVENTRSSVGILSELLRGKQGSYRSVFPKFSMVAYGAHAEEIVGKHRNSVYQFDVFSPYSIAMNKYDAKIVLLGMGARTHKISVFHCATYDCRDNSSFYASCFKKECHGTVIQNGLPVRIDYIDRVDGCSNRRMEFLKLYKKIPKQKILHPGYSIVVFNAKVAYYQAYNYCLNGGKIYTG